MKEQEMIRAVPGDGILRLAFMAGVVLLSQGSAQAASVTADHVAVRFGGHIGLSRSLNPMDGMMGTSLTMDQEGPSTCAFTSATQDDAAGGQAAAANTCSATVYGSARFDNTFLLSAACIDGHAEGTLTVNISENNQSRTISVPAEFILAGLQGWIKANVVTPRADAVIDLTTPSGDPTRDCAPAAYPLLQPGSISYFGYEGVLTLEDWAGQVY
jgi:hypothetical protein